MKDFQPVQWMGGVEGCLRLIDQTRLPGELVEIDCRTVESVWEAIKTLRVRGAPAIGIAAAYGVCLGVQGVLHSDRDALLGRLDEVAGYLATSRPTAVNLFWALERMRDAARRTGAAPTGEIAAALLAEAGKIHAEDRQMCRAMGRHGEALLTDGQGVLTHCNAGGLATSGYGTALAVLFAAAEAGKRLQVYVDETRPLLQGARLTAWELKERGIAATLICDNMAAEVMRQRRVQAVVTGADRIAANGDAANKIGTYGLSVLAAAHAIPFYIVAPSSTFDRSLGSGQEIPIEERDAREVTHAFGRPIAPEGVAVYNPAFDVTPAERITAIVCERGIIRPVNRQTVAAMLS
jgi:methylthioribose-1-phosphate isomerase